MKNRPKSLGLWLSPLGLCLFLASCSNTRPLTFADRQWHVSDSWGQIIDRDTYFRLTFGNVLIPDPLVVISSADSVKRYPGMESFISDVLHTARLDSAEILFYAPEIQTMFVKVNDRASNGKPNSISSPMSDDNPYTMWIYDDNEDWVRKPEEMFTYTYYDKGKKRLLIVDHYDYGDVPIAQITVFQSKNKGTSKMNVPEMPHTIRRSFYAFHDLGNPMNDVEFWASNVESRRKRAFANYKLGQEMQRRNEIDSSVKGSK